MMKRLPVCFFLIAFGAPFAFADGTGSTISRVIPTTGTNTNTSAATQIARNATVATRASASRTTASGPTVVQSTPTATTDEDSETDASTTTNNRSVVGRTATTTTSATTKNGDNSGVVRVGARVLTLNDDDTATSSPRGSNDVRTTTVSRSVQVSAPRTARENLDATVNTVGRNARVEASSINNNPAIRRAGLTLRPSTAEVGGRATIAGTDIQTGSNLNTDGTARTVQARATTTTVSTGTSGISGATITNESISQTKERMDLTSDLNASCQQQYNDCMDQFCDVIDANQGRCSCSANLSSYSRVEEAVTDANNQLNEVAQRIRYVGLSADEIRAIMSETEAEEALSGARDTTETRNMLDEIEALIRDPSSSTSYSGTYDGFGLDMDIDFTTNIADLFSLDFLNTGTTSFSNLRGSELYRAAKNRCNVVLEQCEQAGANIDQITANYDLAIDRDCIAYEQGLNKMNETLVSNVRSANLMLQKARLAVLQNKNQYDAKGCIGALDACMADEMVCGSDYSKCLDPTKRYIDENGDVVLGQDITNIRDFMAGYNNANINSDFLSDSYGSETYFNEDYCAGEGNDGRCVVKYLLQKIGTKEDSTAEGLCRPVLDKCQAYTYDTRGRYMPYNDIVVNYVQRAMVNIQAEQRQIISDYASNCMLDIANCYNQQVTQVNAWSSNASVESIYKVMRGACRNVALTCAYAVFDQDATSCPVGADDTCIESISEMFYQSLLCPDNSVYDETCLNEYNSDASTCVNERCRCLSEYERWGAQCLADCPDNSRRNSYGTCTCNTGYTMRNGVCVSDSEGD